MRVRHHSILTIIVIFIISICVGIGVYNHDMNNYSFQNDTSNDSIKKTTVDNTPVTKKNNKNNVKPVKSLDPNNNNWDMNINTEGLKGITIHNLKFQNNRARKNGYIIHIIGHHMLVGMIEPGSQQKTDQRFFFHLNSISGNTYHFICDGLTMGNTVVNLNNYHVTGTFKNKKSILKEAQRLKSGLNKTELIKE